MDTIALRVPELKVEEQDAYRDAAKVQAACEAASDETINITLGADKGYDAKEFIDACIEMGVTPHVTQNTSDVALRCRST